jgi:PST family polysaccharide transporter
MSSIALPAARPSRTGALVANMATMGAAELVNRATRIATALALAWALTPLEFGLATIAMTATDVMRALTQTGIGARIISVEDGELEGTCSTAYRLNWWVYGGVALIQSLVAWPVALHYGDERIAWLMWAFAIPYLLYPLVAVQVYRVQRQHRMRETAVMLVVLLSGDNLLTAGFAFAGLGLWSLAIPKILCAFAWVVAYRRIERWTPSVAATPVAPLLRYGLTVMASELTSMLRLHADKLIIGQFFGLAVLGQYFFAFNAGLGITTALATAASAALLPHFSGEFTGPTLRARFFKSTGLLLLLIVPIITAQTLFAPWYVPILFGEKWHSAVPLLVGLCWLAVPLLLSRTIGLMLRARGFAALDLKLSLAQAAVALLTLIIMLPFGIEATIAVQVPVLTIATLASMVWALRICCAKGEEK